MPRLLGAVAAAGRSGPCGIPGRLRSRVSTAARRPPSPRGDRVAGLRRLRRRGLRACALRGRPLREPRLAGALGPRGRPRPSLTEAPSQASGEVRLAACAAGLKLRQCGAAGARALCQRIPRAASRLALDFAGCSLGAPGVVALAAALPRGLTELSLDFTHGYLGPDGARVVAGACAPAPQLHTFGARKQNSVFRYN